MNISEGEPDDEFMRQQVEAYRQFELARAKPKPEPAKPEPRRERVHVLIDPIDPVIQAQRQQFELLHSREQGKKRKFSLLLILKAQTVTTSWL